MDEGVGLVLERGAMRGVMSSRMCRCSPQVGKDATLRVSHAQLCSETDARRRGPRAC
jgi:hypothetical protein